jgi:predicted SAM-dependent methyltransferase
VRQRAAHTRQAKRLHWGCGGLHPPGWINADSGPGPGVDIACDIVVDGLPLPSASIERIYCSPSLERVPAHQLLAVLRELHRVLEPGGLIRLCVPDFDRALDAYRRQEDAWRWCWLWDSPDGNFLTQLLNHGYARSLFTKEFATELLRRSGFSSVSLAAFGRSASGFSDWPDQGHRAQECLFIEARKRHRPHRAPGETAAAAAQIHLSWEDDPATTLTVSWTMPGASPRAAPVLQYRRAGALRWKRLLSRRKPSLTRRTLFAATLRDLSPDSEYEYRITARQAANVASSDVYRARTAPLGSADFRFAFFCDTGVAGRPGGNASGTREVIEAMVGDAPLFVLGGGDYAYADHDGRYAGAEQAIDAWFAQMQPLLARHPFMAQYGNHEIYLGERFRDWAPHFCHPPGFDESRNYSFRVGDAHFTALFVTGNRLTPQQLAWLEADLAGARQSGCRWLIVYQHEPLFAHGRSHPANPEYRRWLAPLFERYGVDLHLSGHDQSYERTYPLLMAAHQPVRTSRARVRYRRGQGVVYAKVSPAGKKSDSGNDFSRFTVPQQPFVACRDDSAHHYALVTVRACGELVMEVFGLAGDGSPRFLVDAFRIVEMREHGARGVRQGEHSDAR